MIDQVTMLLSSSNLMPFTELSKFLDVFTYPILFLFWCFFVLRRDKKKTTTLLLAAIFVIGSVLVLKGLYNSPRPCEEITSKIVCPTDGSFPSGHTTAAAMFIPAFLELAAFPLYLLFYLAVAASRMYLGVHTLEDIVGGTLVGIITYFIADWIISGKKSFIGRRSNSKTLAIDKEIKRQLFHILLGLLLTAAFFYFSTVNSVEWIRLFTLLIFLGGLCIINKKQLSKKGKLPFIDSLLGELERPGATPGHGAFWLIVGLLIAISFLGNDSEIIATMLILSVSDGVATLFGRFGKQKLPYNRKKTYLGSALFFISALLSYLFIGQIALLLAAFLTIVESLSTPIDDNLLVSLAAVVFFAVF